MTTWLLVLAQAATVAVFQAAAVDPNTTPPLRQPVLYAAPVCNQIPAAETLPIVNPIEGRYPDPANPARDCRLDVQAQMTALPGGTGYKGAVKVGAGVYGPFSSPFAVTLVQLPAHACDTTPVSPTSVNVGQTFTLAWCHPSLDTNGQPTVVVAWHIYRNGVLLGAAPFVGTTLNAAGFRLVTLTGSEPVAGAVSYVLSAVNSTGASLMSPALALTVVAIPTVPIAPSRGRVTVQ